MKYEVLSVLDKIKRGKISPNSAFKMIADIFCPNDTPFENVKVGDFLVFDKVYSQSKRYTQGKKYRVNNVAVNKSVIDDDFFLGKIKAYVSEFSIIDDNGKKRWIKETGLPNYQARLITT